VTAGLSYCNSLSQMAKQTLFVDRRDKGHKDKQSIARPEFVANVATTLQLVPNGHTVVSPRRIRTFDLAPAPLRHGSVLINWVIGRRGI
jgi:hypothetical protein